jgi:hypothetical protein
LTAFQREPPGEIAGAFFARRALLRLRNAAAQTRIVSAARIRLDSGNLCDLSNR